MRLAPFLIFLTAFVVANGRTTDQEYYLGNPVVSHHILVSDGAATVASAMNLFGWTSKLGTPQPLLFDNVGPQWYVVSVKPAGADNTVENLLATARGLDLRAEPDYELNMQDMGSDGPIFAPFTPSIGMPLHPCQTASPGMPLHSSPRVGVAVFDTGMDVSNPYFAGCLWTHGAFEVQMPDPTDPLNATVTNTCASDTAGFNAVAFAPELVGAGTLPPPFDSQDEDGHGSHCAGIVASFTKDNFSNAFVVPCKITEHGSASAQTLMNAFSFVVQANELANANIRVVSLSWGGAVPSKALYEAMDYAASHGLLVVCSAGNGHESSDLFPRYPASFNLPSTFDDGSGDVAHQSALGNILTVASIDCDGRLARTSNYGINSVDIAAFGERVVCPGIGTGAWVFSGTSAAAARVSGAAASLFCVSSNLTPEQAKWTITSNGAMDPFLAHFVYSRAALDLPKAWENPIKEPVANVFASPGLVLIRAGEKASTNLSLQKINGFAVDLKIEASLAPSGISPMLPSGPLVVMPTALKDPLTIQTATDTPKGLYFVTISARDPITGRKVSETMFEVSVY